MKLSEIGVTGQPIDVCNGGDVAPNGRLLSVAEIQQGFRKLLTELRAHPPGAAPEVAVTNDGVAAAVIDPAPGGPVDQSADVNAAWITVLAAHSGAGSSTVALAVADAAAAAGQVVHLMESAHPARSGLVAASSSELGLDPTGTWRRGLRGQVTIDRRAGEATPAGWPDTVESSSPTTVVDLGLPSVGNMTRLAANGGRCILVSRATIPGVRLAEQALDALADVAVVVAVLGASRWPGEVTSSLGPRLRRLRADGQVVTVPIERHIEVTGPTNSALPKSVLASRPLAAGADQRLSARMPSPPRRSMRAATGRNHTMSTLLAVKLGAHYLAAANVCPKAPPGVQTWSDQVSWPG